MLVRALQRALQLRGVALHVTEASNGVEGAAAAASNVDMNESERKKDTAANTRRPPLFDIYLTDAEMPGLDGYDMMRVLRSRGDQTPAIGITGNALSEDIERFIRVGVQSVVTKPVAISALVAELYKLLPWLEGS